MKIEITATPPLSKHYGITEGKIFTVVKHDPPIYGVRGAEGYWIVAAGEKVKILPRECKVIEGEANE